MDVVAAQTLAIRLMTEHGLTDRGWSFKFDRAEKRLGQCVYRTRTISMSRLMVAAATEDEVEQTMLHEIAHALAGPAAGHGPAWKAQAAAIGYRGKTTAENPHLTQQFAAQGHTRITDLNLPRGTRVITTVGDRGVILTAKVSRYHVALTDRQRIVNGQPGAFFATGEAPMPLADVAELEQRIRASRRRGTATQQQKPRPSLAAGFPLPSMTLWKRGDMVQTRNLGTCRVVNFGGKRYRVAASDGREYYIYPAAITGAASAADGAGAAAAAPRERMWQPGERVHVRGKGDGKVVRFGGKRYRILLDDGTEWYIGPANIVGPAKNPVQPEPKPRTFTVPGLVVPDPVWLDGDKVATLAHGVGEVLHRNPTTGAYTIRFADRTREVPGNAIIGRVDRDRSSSAA